MTATTTRISDACDEDRDRWDEYVARHPQATFFHRFGWRQVLREAFRHKSHYLIAERDGRIVGVLPLGEIRSFLFGHALISTPFCVYGGALADDSQCEAQLIEAACGRARELKVDHLELRHLNRKLPTWPCKDSLYVTFRKPITADDAENLKAIPRKQRAMVRAGIDAGLSATVESDARPLWEMYSESVRNLGTPVYPQRYFAVLQREFGASCEIVTIRNGEQALASVMSFYFRDEVLPYYGGGSANARQFKANDFMYWVVMQRAAARGVRLFDYGRSKHDTGSFSFKKHWGFEPTPLYYEYYLVRAKALPNVSPTNPKYQMFIAAWRSLPLPVSRLLGPLLARSLG
jgi:FemAB-related protein (PEP-CTERM system-associated)